MHEQARFQQLRSAYDEAFERLCDEVRMLEFAESHDNVGLAAQLRRRVADAEQAYRRRRDALARFLMEHPKSDEREQDFATIE